MNTAMRAFHDAAYQRRRRVMQTIMAPPVQITKNEVKKGSHQTHRKRLLSTVTPSSDTFFDFDSSAFVAAIRNASGLSQNLFGQASLQVLQMASSSSVDVEPSPYSAVLAGIDRCTSPC